MCSPLLWDAFTHPHNLDGIEQNDRNKANGSGHSSREFTIRLNTEDETLGE
ncbi:MULTISPECIES: hypothetical protein [unclassified Thermococcus]|uniref:hypothetical protein n=1 Tax=unclassified Thermococcus TaxID=2627626 RepID=UPI0014304C8A|nr:MULTISPECIES: hypothetical protein [unclassified Thermococcus]